MISLDPLNTMFTLAAGLVNHTSKNIFLTGKAGTGKTTFLKYIRETSPKQMAVVAPTGVAAINAGGVTIHSLFQLPLSPFIPEAKGFNKAVSNKHSVLARLRMTKEKQKILQQLELLVIDEISMVRADVLDAVDTVLRHVRHKWSEAFGGVQVLFIGDMFQLPPVVKDNEWQLLSEYYDSPFFFDSQVLKEEGPVHIELTKIYRQTEEQFIGLLNKVRNNEMDEDGFHLLQNRYQADSLVENSGHIILTTHNEKARNINAVQLQKLPSGAFLYKADIDGEFYDSAYPEDELLQLKVEAQVMFIKNDPEKSKRYFNGKIGIVTELGSDKILVQCKGETEAIEVKKEKWENIRYTFNKATRQLDEEVLGSFTQYPLRLAWAITIHKSQGLTFEKAVIDAGEAFAPGQVYVALSRCTCLEGLLLKTKVRPNSFLSNPRILQFSRNISASDELQQQLEEAKKIYEEKTLVSLFDFNKTINEVKVLQDYLEQNRNSFNEEVIPWINELHQKFFALQTTAQKFHIQLRQLFLLKEKPDENLSLKERIKAAGEYFDTQLNYLITDITQSTAITDSKLHAKEYNELLKEIFAQLSMQKYLLAGFSGKFDMETFHRCKNSFVLPAFHVNAYATASSQKTELLHPVLHVQLRELRNRLCAQKDLPIYYVASSKTIDEMVQYLPQSPENLIKISGFGKAKVDQYGKAFLEIIQSYCSQHGLSSLIYEKKPKRERKERDGSKRVDTKLATFKLYKQGKSINDIAASRNLAVSTIESHLAYFVAIKEIQIYDLVSEVKVRLIQSVLAEMPEERSTINIKAKLDDSVSFGEIRAVMAYVRTGKTM
ncbi:MAG: helix-turn-helix domain-containing protein [Chitinophagaceae bacterium]